MIEHEETRFGKQDQVLMWTGGMNGRGRVIPAKKDLSVVNRPKIQSIKRDAESLLVGQADPNCFNALDAFPGRLL